MRQLLRSIRQALVSLVRRAPSNKGLTAVEYEAVCLIAYEGREAYACAREQADYCRSLGSSSGTLFWSQVAAEVGRRTNRPEAGKLRAPPR
jgi:hypothetical protein